MRFIIHLRANEASEAGVMPSTEVIAAMGEYNEKLARAGVLLAVEGLHPSSKGARVEFSGKGPTVIDGPFAEAKELIAGFWIIDVKSKEEAIEWVKRIPNPDGEAFTVDIRQVGEVDDFGEALTPELRQRGENWRSDMEQGLSDAD